MDVAEPMKKKIWKEEKTSNEWKDKNIENIQSRLSGWQLETFKVSYANKKKNSNLNHLSLTSYH